MSITTSEEVYYFTLISIDCLLENYLYVCAGAFGYNINIAFVMHDDNIVITFVVVTNAIGIINIAAIISNVRYY